MVVFRITSHKDERIAGQAEGVVHMLRLLEDKVSLSADIEFDETGDSELHKLEHQRAVKEVI
jgi:hypothetical protein